MDFILILIILLSIVIIIIKIAHKIYKNKIKEEKSITSSSSFFYDGTSLSNPAKKKSKINRRPLTSKRKVDCNSNIIECNHNFDCHINCIYYKDHKTKCLNGLCVYKKQNSKTTLCENGGQIASYFSLGRTITTCICPENFIGPFCQIPNQMKPSESRTFEITY